MAVHVGKRIEYLMRLKGVPPKQIAEWLELSESAVSRLLDRESQKTEHLFVLSDQTGIPIEAFVRESDTSLQSMVKETPVPYVPTPKRSLTDCETELARMQERTMQLEARIADKDELIQVLKTPRS